MKHYRIFWLLAIWLGVCWSSKGYAMVQADLSQDTVLMESDPVRLYIMAPDPERPNLLLDSLRQLITVERGDFMSWVDFAQSEQGDEQAGSRKYQRPIWILAVFGLLLLFFGIIKAAFPAETIQIILAFYNDRVLTQVNKEDHLFSSWPFVFLYILFGFSCGLFLYLLSAHLAKGVTVLGFQGFIWISIFVLVLFSIKIFVTRMLGIIFQARRMVREYISVLYLCYFNASLIFIPAVLMLSLATKDQSLYIMWGVVTIIFGLFAFRLLKTGIAILEKHQFPKFYLITYLCTLEIIPMLILMKVLA